MRLVDLLRWPVGHPSCCPGATGGLGCFCQRCAKRCAKLAVLAPTLHRPTGTFGFVRNAEVLNSRAAMIGFFALLAVEAIANKGLLQMLGLQVGKGLGFEF